jgi:hypothetical protein
MVVLGRRVVDVNATERSVQKALSSYVVMCTSIFISTAAHATKVLPAVQNLNDSDMPHPRHSAGSEADVAARYLGGQVAKLSIVSVCLAIGAFICSMVGWQGRDTLQFTPVAFALVILHHGAILLQRWKRSRPGPADESIKLPLSANAFVISLHFFILFLWSFAFSWLIFFLVNLAHNFIFFREDVATVVEFVFVSLEVIVLVILGILCVKERRLFVEQVLKSRGGSWHRLDIVEPNFSRSRSYLHSCYLLGN